MTPAQFMHEIVIPRLSIESVGSSQFIEIIAAVVADHAVAAERAP
jgi:hypothetical protein